MSDITLRVGLQQRVLPDYRAAFVDALARELSNGLAVFAGEPRPEEHIVPAVKLETARFTHAQNIRLGGGWFAMDWQLGWREWSRREALQTVILESNPRNISNYLLLDRLKRHHQIALGWSLGPARALTIARNAPAAFYGRFDALITYSQHGADAFCAIGIPEERIFVAPNAVESVTAEKMLAAPNAREAARAALDLDARPVLLFVGRLQARKHVDALVRAAARQSPECQVLVVGDGPDRSRLEAIAAEFFPSTQFLGDRRGESLGNCFLAADLFVMPGTGGLALQEALIYGKPVVVAEADGSQRDLVQPGVNGWLLPSGDVNALSAILQDALSDLARLEAMGSASRRIVQRTATLERMVAGFLDALRYVQGQKTA